MNPHLLVHSPNVYNNQGWLKYKPKVSNSIKIFLVGERDPSTWTIISASKVHQQESMWAADPRQSNIYMGSRSKAIQYQYGQHIKIYLSSTIQNLSGQQIPGNPIWDVNIPRSTLTCWGAKNTQVFSNKCVKQECYVKTKLSFMLKNNRNLFSSPKICENFPFSCYSVNLMTCHKYSSEKM